MIPIETQKEINLVKIEPKDSLNPYKGILQKLVREKKKLPFLTHNITKS